MNHSIQSRRRRASSVVQRIALNTPTLEQFDQVNIHENKPLKLRSHSFTCFSDNNNGTEKPTSFLDKYYLYPLSENEKQNIWNFEIDQYDSNLNINLNDELIIRDNNQTYPIESTENFKNYLNLTKSENSGFILEINEIIENLDNLLEINSQVTLQTSEFQSKSNNLITELEKINSIFINLNKNLVYFESLDSIVQKLNASNNSKMVLKENFKSEILTKLDDCLHFVNNKKYKNYKEIGLYKYKFKQCMIRALTLIRNFLINKIRNIESGIQNKINNNLTSKNGIFDALIYSKFQEDLSSIYPLFVEIYERSINIDNINNPNIDNDGDSDNECFGLLNDCYNQYFKSRKNLISNFLDPYMLTQNSSNKNMIELSRINLSYFNKLIGKEYEVFKALFFLPNISDSNYKIDNSTNLTVLNRFFENLLEPLYYLLRNKIIREIKITELCELITILQNYLEFDQDEFSVNYKINYEELFQPILEDVQTRLVFRVQIFVEKNIVNYKKTGKELIIGNRKIKQNEDINGSDNNNTNTNDNENNDENNIENENLSIIDSKLIYPPIIRAIKLLTKIYQLLNQSIFDDLANSIVHLSILSLKNNFNNISNIDSKLYQLRSLIFFKEYINTFDIEHFRKESSLDFTGLKNLYSRFIGGQKIDSLKTNNHESLLNAILGSIPKVINDFIDCKFEIQIELRNLVHEFIQISTKNFTKSLEEYNSTGSDKNLKNCMDNFVNDIKIELPILKPRIKNYINDNKILEFLIDGVQEEVIKQYEAFYNQIVHDVKSEKIEDLLGVDSIINIWGNVIKEIFLGDDSDDEDEQNHKQQQLLDLDVEDIGTLDELDSVLDGSIAMTTVNTIGVTENADISHLSLNSLK